MTTRIFNHNSHYFFHTTFHFQYTVTLSILYELVATFSHKTAFASTYLLLVKIVGSLSTGQQGGKCSVVRRDKWLGSRLTY